MKLEKGVIHIYQLDNTDYYDELKSILARYLKVSSEELVIERNDRGKPYLAGELGKKLYFNITHTDKKMLVAIAKDPVGIDMENLSRKIAYEPILKRYFTLAEQQDFLKVLEDKTQCPRELFLKGWTRKEAVLKAVGVGLGGIKDYEISFSEPRARNLKSLFVYPMKEFVYDEEYWTSVSLINEFICRVVFVEN